MAEPHLNFAFPKWPMEQIVHEACANWNLRQPDKPCDAQKSEWNFLFAVVHSWARHALTNYDALVTPQTRETLRAKISGQVANAYPWLRQERDPRDPAEVRPTERPLPFEKLAGCLSLLSSRRSQLLLALKDARRAKASSRTAITEMEKEIDEIDELMGDLLSRVRPDENGNRHLVIQHESGDYFWGGRDLAPNLVRPVKGSRCPECGCSFWRTKRAVNCGAGVRNVIISCHCKTIFADADYLRRLKGQPGLHPETDASV
jgi:hypothetical protein